MEKDPLLSVNNLKVYFHGEETVSRAVDGVNYQVGKGEIVSLVGESGCGKTVSALAILGLIPCPPGKIEDGEILFKNKNLLNLNEDQMQKVRGRQISMVFQEPMTSLNPVFTIGDQIQEVILNHEKVGKEVALKRTIALLQDVGIPSPEDRVKDYPHLLSGGQRQRVMIAMALACGPDLVIADEPTTALDVTVQAQILQLFRELQQKRNMAVLLITHNLGVVAEIADRIYVMYAGVIVETGTVKQVFKAPFHPYTMGLLAALPSSSRKGKPLYSIPGSVPDSAYKPEGCPFNPRCPYVRNECKIKFPEMVDFETGHQARCPITLQLWKNRELPNNRFFGLENVKRAGRS